MKRLRKGLGYGVLASGAFVCAATLLPVLKARTWIVRVFDFPRIQIAGLGLLTLSAALSGGRRRGAPENLFLGGVGLAVATQIFRILKYTPLAPRQVLRNTAPSPASALSILVANVRMKNRDVGKLLGTIKALNPDIVILLEPNHWWLKELSCLEARYPWHTLVPRENTYGIAQYSRLEVLESETRYLVQRDVPSIRSRVRLRNGQAFWLYAVHPRPPVRGNLEGALEFPGSGKRDAELVRVALEARTLNEPLVITGDFNDVAWSHTTRHFQRLGKLLDPRVGRGLFNTYHAGHWWLRFPVDHLFHSKEFTVVEFSRGPDIGSDHFPISATLALDTFAEQSPPERHEGDMEEAVEKLEKAKQD